MTKQPTKITVMHYPDTFRFETRAKLPPFKPYCRVRTRILQAYLRKFPILFADCHHDVTDFVVERMRKVKGGGECWEVAT